MPRRSPPLRLDRLRSLANEASVSDLLSVLVMVLVALAMLLTVGDYGLTYDEAPHVRYGDRVLRFYLGGFRSSPWLAKSSYGAGFDLLAALLRRVSPFDEFQTNHLLCAFIAQLGLLGTWKLGRLVAGPAGALLSLVFLLSVPVYYGHQFNNPKDIPFAAGYVWGLYCIARVLGHLGRAERPRAGVWWGLGVSFGLGMSVRVGGVLLVAYLIAFLVALALDRARCARPGDRGLLAHFAGRALLACLLGWVVMALFWPRALMSPVRGPREALQSVSDYTIYDSPTLLAGKRVSSNDLPWDYLPRYFAGQMPELITAVALLAVVGVCFLSLRRLRRRELLPWPWWLLVVATFAPPVFAIVRGSTLYNGLRHFLFLVPPLAVLGGAAAAVGIGWTLRARPRWAWAPVLVIAGFAADQLHALVRLHPYQHVFFNRASGGVAAAVGRYETEYYGSVYQALHRDLADFAWRSRPTEYLSTVFGVSGCGSKLFFTHNLPLNFAYHSMRRIKRSHYYSTYVRDRCLQRLRGYEPVLSLERDGAQLAVVRDLKRKKQRRSGERSGSPAGAGR